jgi:hypothetical protein
MWKWCEADHNIINDHYSRAMIIKSWSPSTAATRKRHHHHHHTSQQQHQQPQGLLLPTPSQPWSRPCGSAFGHFGVSCTRWCCPNISSSEKTTTRTNASTWPVSTILMMQQRQCQPSSRNKLWKSPPTPRSHCRPRSPRRRTTSNDSPCRGVADDRSSSKVHQRTTTTMTALMLRTILPWWPRTGLALDRFERCFAEIVPSRRPMRPLCNNVSLVVLVVVVVVVADTTDWRSKI